MIGFAREAKALGRLDRFIHVSTAYVSGKFEGTFRERQLDAGQDFRNTYEQTKWEAEHIVGAATDLQPAIARPSIVMGESDSGWTPAFNVLYWPLRAFSRGLFDEVPHCRRPTSTSSRSTTSPTRSCDCSSARPGRREPRRRARGVVRRRGRRSSRATASTGRGPRSCPGPAGTGTTTSRRGLPAVLRHGRRLRRLPHPGRAAGPGAAPRLTDFFGALMDYAEETRWGKRGMTREEARERVGREPAAA